MDSKLFEQMLGAAVSSGASDLHLKAGAPCMVREGYDLTPITEQPMHSADIEQIVERILEQVGSRYGKSITLENLKDLRDLDASYSLPGVGRFRVNIYRQRGTIAMSMRVIPSKVPSIDDLRLPQVLKEIAEEARGMVLVTGTTGSGKSTTLTAMIHHINLNYRRKIVTIEDPIEFLMPDIKASISQREVGSDTKSFATAMRAALRQDPDIIMVGEMRDRETIEIALKAAETGHMVLSTAHTRDAVNTIARLLGAFELNEHGTMRMRLAESLRAILSQRLVPCAETDGRIAAVEIMRMTGSIQERILNADPRGFVDLIEQGSNPYRMQTFDQHLLELYRGEVITLETALTAATSPTNLKRNLKYEDL